MRETKIIVDKKRKEPFVIYEKDGILFKEIETTPTHQEALDYCNGRSGKFVGTYMDGVLIPKKEVLQKLKTEFETSNVTTRYIGEPAQNLDENEDVLYKRTMGKTKKLN